MNCMKPSTINHILEGRHRFGLGPRGGEVSSELMAQIVPRVDEVPPQLFKPGLVSSSEDSIEKLAFHGSSH